MEEHDLRVSGGGPAGEKGAVNAAFYGNRVVLIERSDYFVGSGRRIGKYPSKTLHEASLYNSRLLKRGFYGIDYSLKENLFFRDFLHRERVVVDHQRHQAERNIKLHHYQTDIPNIYPAGDIIGFPALATTSMEQAFAAMVHAFDLGCKAKLAPFLPLAVYTIPEISALSVT